MIICVCILLAVLLFVAVDFQLVFAETRGMRKLRTLFVTALGVVALYCGVLAVSAGPAKADYQQCDCVLGNSGCQMVSCVTNWTNCNMAGIDCSVYLAGLWNGE